MIFEFYCDPGAGCDTDVQFWYRLTPSPVGAGEYIHAVDSKLLVKLIRHGKGMVCIGKPSGPSG